MSRILRDVRVLDALSGRDERADVAVLGPSGDVDGRGLVLCPAFVDLAAHRESAADDAAATSGGFATCLGTPGLAAREEGPQRLRMAELTVRSAGDELADMGSAVADGAVAIGDGGKALGSSRTLLAALRYAADLDVPVFLRPSDPDLEHGGLTRAGSHAVLLGLPGVQPEAEAMGVYRASLLAKASGCRVHLTQLWSAQGIAALREVKASTPGLTASTTPLHLTQRPERIEELAYAGWARIHPPVGDDEDRRALIEALVDGTLDAVASHHRSVPRHQQDCELGIAVPGTRTQAATFGLVHRATGSLEVSVRVLTAGPRSVLGRAVDERWWALVDPEATWTVGDGPTALAGESVRGRVVELVQPQR
ncbi:MAG: hypothetical protein EP330_11970 [Deltaproteobacteria bacterium]|nr:MAG: hypothetical protein EP330_11970 [Deltaproteobacteria bacterium]